MGSYREIKGNLIRLAIKGEFDVIVHGCNCFCRMGAGIAPQMAIAFGADKFPMEAPEHRGDMNKLGTIDHKRVGEVIVVNAYSQFGFGKNHTNGTSIPLDYEALTLCLRKINYNFKGDHIGLPMIGCGLAGGDEKIVIKIIKWELKDCNVTLVRYDNIIQ